MKLSQFNFKLPQELIALYPNSVYHEIKNEKGEKEMSRLTRRDECRLMVLHKKSGTIDLFRKDKKGKPVKGDFLQFRDVIDYFDEGDTFIFNDTKVFPARLYGMKEKTDAKIEVFLLRELSAEQRLWDVLVDPARKIRIGNKLYFGENGDLVAEVIDNTTSRGRTLRFLYDCDHDEFKRSLFALGSSLISEFDLGNSKSITIDSEKGKVYISAVSVDDKALIILIQSTQSAMLEAMQEKQTSIGGQRYDLPKPFIVLATQNPIEQEGTYELPEAQLDRFLLKEVLSYPAPDEELEILKRIESGKLSEAPNNSNTPNIELAAVETLQNLAQKVYIDDTIKNYIVKIVSATRNPASIIPSETARYVQYGASPRASIAFQQVAKALALINGRNYVIPEDVKQLRHSVLRHRIILNFEAIADQVHPEVIIDSIFNAVPVP